MRAMPFSLPGKGVLDVSEICSVAVVASAPALWKKEGGLEPTSVLDTRRSPSPPTSTSTLSCGGGGGGGASTDSAGVAAVYDNHPPSHGNCNSNSNKWQQEEVCGGATSEGSRRDEWALDLQPIPSSLEMVGGEKCGLGIEDCWVDMLAGSAPSPPGSGHEQSFIRWIMGDMEEPSSALRPLVHEEAGGPGATSFGLVVDPGFGFEPPPSTGLNLPVNPTMAPAPGTDFPPFSSTSSSTTRMILPPNPTGSLPNLKPPQFSTSPSNPIFSNSSANSHQMNLPLPPGFFYQQGQEPVDEKPQLVNINQHQSHPTQNTTFFLPSPYGQQDQQHLFLSPHPKRHQPEPPRQITSRAPFTDMGAESLFRRQQQQPQPQGFSHLFVPNSHQLQQQRGVAGKPGKLAVDEAAMAAQQQQQAVLDQLVKAAELVEAGNSIHARGILARLNHHQLSSPVGKHPLLRAAFYFKEALHLLLEPNSATTTASSSQVAVVSKLSAYKLFSEVSPVLQFANFTANQALLEALDGFPHIHILDFDIGIGSQWSSFMKEISGRLGGAPSLKITAFLPAAAAASTHDLLELGLTRQNLSHFAADLNISFDFRVVALDSIDPSAAASFLGLSDNEALAVNLPVGFASGQPTASLLRLVKQLNPKLVVSLDRGADQSDLPFSHHFLRSLHSHSVLLDSLDGTNVNPEAVQKIERFVIRPRIEKIVAGRHYAGDKMLPWRTLFASAGFSPVPFSSFTVAQAEYLVKQLQLRGFHFEKRQASLYLYWQRGELVSVSVWRC